MAHLFCKNCNGYYKLKSNERASDFECCNQCGGSLEYVKDNVDDPHGWDFSGTPDDLIKRRKHLAKEKKNPKINKKSVKSKRNSKTRKRNYSYSKHKSYVEEKRSEYDLIMIVGVFVVFIGILGGILGLSLLFILVIVGMFMVSYGYYNGESWRKGARGEKLVANHLSKLPKEYITINDVKIPNLVGNIDHVVVGPSGIYAIETKNYSSCYFADEDYWYYCNSRQKAKTNPAKQAKIQALKLNEFISEQAENTLNRLYVHPIVVPINSNLIFFQEIESYSIVFPDKLVEFISKKHNNFNSNDVEIVTKILSK
ncbi:MAG: nuclease-related domain-containing protein [Methanobacterium sp.]